MPHQLHAQSRGQGEHVILLHGLFGMGSNLGALARALAGSFAVHQLDLPDHGRSRWLPESSLALMADAVAQWMDECQIGTAHLIGHSLGGKVAMQLALNAPARVRSLVAADIAPVAYPASHDAVFAAIDAVAEAGCQSRREAADLMRAHLREDEVIRFLLLSLAPSEGPDAASAVSAASAAGKDAAVSAPAQGAPPRAWRWLFNREGLKRSYAAYRAAPELSSSGPYPGPVLFIRGEHSDYVREAHRDRILAFFPRADVRVMAGCGHWLHAQKPELFNSLVVRFLRERQPAHAVPA